MKYIGAQLVN